MERMTDGGPTGGPKQRKAMKEVHSLELENWLLQQAMAASVLCLYDKDGLRVGSECYYRGTANAAILAGTQTSIG